jgi:hypothetical protein
MNLNPEEVLWLLFFIPYVLNSKSEKETAKDRYVCFRQHVKKKKKDE